MIKHFPVFVALVIILSSVTVLLLCGNASEEFPKIKPSAQIVYDNESGYIKGLPSEYTAQDVATLFEGNVIVTTPSGDEVSANDKVGSDYCVKGSGGEVKLIVYGDVNRDAKINARDVIAVMRHLVGENIDLCTYAMDVYPDGKFNSRDVVAIMKYLVGENEILGERFEPNNCNSDTFETSSATGFAETNDPSEAKNYSVTFKDWDETILKMETVNEGENATPPADPSREGYDFIGWNGTYTNVKSNLVIVATYEITTSSPVFIVETRKTAAGSNVQVTISVKNNPGVAGALLTINSDPKLTLTGATAGGAFSNLTYTRPGKYSNSCNFCWDSESGMASEDGVVLTLDFTVSEDADIGEKLDIICSYKNGDIYDEQLNNVSFEIVNGAIEIIK